MDNKHIDMNIPKEKFAIINHGERISDKKFEDKPIGYFKDAWIRFRKSKASVAAAIIIIIIILYSFLAPVLITNHDASFMCTEYSKLPGRVSWAYELGLNGSINLKPSDNAYIRLLSLGMAAEDTDGAGDVTLEEGLASKYQPVLSTGETYTQDLPGGKTATYYPSEVDAYLQVGFIYKTVEPAEYERILAWQEQTGLQVLYPLTANNEWNPDYEDANNWYKVRARGLVPVKVDSMGNAKTITYKEGMVLDANYELDAEGNVKYYKLWGGGDLETAQYKIRVLYYNYYQYMYGSEPDYIMGTDAQGYDLALRIAGGIKLSLLIAVSVSVINFILGAMWGSTAGYYGGWIDIVMERITDILSGVPFMIVATLFQIHLAKKVGALPCLLFAYIMTGWIGTASRVRTQFYRYKHQEYVMAARTLGARDRRIIWKHIFPNTLGTIITSSALVIPSTILSESMLSFLGIVNLGSADGTSLGTLLSEASGIWTNYPHLMLYPALVISLLMVCFNLFGNGLRDAFNPALRGVEE